MIIASNLFDDLVEYKEFKDIKGTKRIISILSYIQKFIRYM